MHSFRRLTRIPGARLNSARSLPCWITLAVLTLLTPPVSLRAQVAPPDLQIDRSSTGLTLRWPASAGESNVLEQSPALGPDAHWQPVATPATVDSDFRSVQVAPTDAPRFYRLRQDASTGPTQVVSTSPASGESGISVNRETILHFSRPLARTTLLDTDQFHALANGRRLLSRVALGTDRLSATLFYLENLPGGARVTVVLDGDTVLDSLGLALDADGDGLPGGRLEFTFDTTVNAPVPGTAVIGRVFASDLAPGSDTGTNAVNRPLAGVTITVDGAEESLRTTTDEQGNFTLDPAPSGRFFVHIDGRTAWESQWPLGDYYPFVGKAWDAVPGVATNLAGGSGIIYLPRVAAGSLQSVSASSDTTITFPASVLADHPTLQGVSVTVPANALFDEDGSRGGRIGIAPVPPDRLPEPLPPGLSFPIVITVQSDGPANFDRPVPLRFPNLPDPLTGLSLPPGAKTALWAFNHDTGHWEIRGPMTVSADGRFIDCDPGTGILQPGWVGTNPGSPAGGGPPRPPAPPTPPDNRPDCDNPLTMIAKENLLLQYATGMELVSGNGNYAGEALRHFLLGDGSPQHYPPGSGPSQDLLNSEAFKNELSDIQSSLRNQVQQAITQNSEFPTPDAFEHQTGNMSFYGEPGALLHQLSYTFGDVSESNTDAQLSDIFVTHADDGGYDYFAKLKFKVTERYEFNSNDPDGLVGMARQLQDCGYAEPFDVSIEFELDLTGHIGPRAQPALLAPARHSPTPAPPRLSGPGPHILAQVSQTTVLRLGPDHLILHPNGRSIRARGDQLLAGTFDLLVEDADTGALISRDTRRGSENLFLNLILPPARNLHLRILHRESLSVAEAFFRSANSGFPTTIPDLGFGPLPAGPDPDADGLSDETESIVGTRPDRADTDGDGVSDLAELRSGQDPNSGLTAATGIVASVKTAGSAGDIAAYNHLVVIADGFAGVAVFNVFAGLEPVRIAQLTLDGSVQSVACDARWIAAATANSLGIWEITGSPTPVLRHLLRPPGFPGELAIDAGAVYVASGTDILLVDALTGAVIDRRTYVNQLNESLHDLAIDRDHLYALSAAGGVGGSHTLHRIPIAPLLLPATSALTIPGTDHPTFGRMHLFAGAGRLYVGSADDNAQTQRPGILIAEDGPSGIRIIGRPAPITAFNVEVNGSGLALFTGADPGLTSSARLGVLDVRDPVITDRFLTAYDTPAAAIAIALQNGLAYVSDSSAGLQVVNFLPFDRNGLPPSVTLESNLPAGTVSAGDRVRITAVASDDVQIRHVEFHLNGIRVATDGAFPFEYSFLAPAPTPDQPRLTLRARATDTGGNETWSADLPLTLVEASAAQGNFRLLPPPDATVPAVTTFGLLFDAALDPNLPPTFDHLGLIWAGPDGQLDSPDDSPVVLGDIQYIPRARAILRVLPDELRTGLYRATLASGLRDLTGQSLPGTNWTFRAITSTAFRVVETSPPGGTVEALSRIILRFNEPIDPASITPDGVQLFHAGPDATFGTADDRRVPGEIQILPSGEGVSLEVGPDLSAGLLRIRVPSLITDRAGNPLPFEHTVDLTFRDTSTPEILLFNPEPGTRLTTAPTEIEVYFSEPIDPVTLADSAYQLLGSGPDEQLLTADDLFLGGSVTYTPSLRRATLRLNGSLPPGVYRHQPAPDIRDLNGNALGSVPPADFIIAKVAQVRAQVVLASGLPAVDATVRIAGVAEPLSTGPDGSFLSLPFEILPGQLVFARVQLPTGASVQVGGSAPVLPRHNAITDLGRIVLQEVCPPTLDATPFATAPVDGELNTFTVGDLGDGPALFAGTGAFYGAKRARVLQWSGSGWRTLGADFTFAFGSTAHVRALAVHDDGHGPRLYAGGEFDRIGSVGATNIARWNGSAWEPVGRGLAGFGIRGQVLALANFDPGPGVRLLAGGTFSEFLGAPRTAIMQWNGVEWSPFSGGLSNLTFQTPSVHALLATTEQGRPTLYAGGVLTTVNDSPAGNLARWQDGAWTAVPGAITRSGQTNFARVSALAWHPSESGPELFVGGSFDAVDGQPALSVARWNGSTWKPAGTGFGYSFQSQLGSVQAFLQTAAPNPELLAAGLFNRVDGQAFLSNGPGLARWSGDGWEVLTDSDGRTNGLNGIVRALAEFNDGAGRTLFLGGEFNDVLIDRNSRFLPYVARLTPDGWAPAGHPLDRPIRDLALAALGSQPPAVFVAGDFIGGGGSRLNGIFQLTNGTFQPLGQGLGFESPFSFPQVLTLAAGTTDGSPSLYVGGYFELAGTGRAASIARWDGTTWHPLGAGVTTRFGGATVLDLAVEPASLGGGLIAGGGFNTAGSVTALNIARWDGTQWSPLGNGLNGSVLALAHFAPSGLPSLFAAGDFTVLDSQFRQAGSIARWDGAVWQPVRGDSTLPPSGRIAALAVHDDGTGPALYAGGTFTTTSSGDPANAVARWNGREWEHLTTVIGSIRFGAVYEFATHHDGTASRLYAIVQPSVESNIGFEPHLAAWDGSAWEVFEQAPLSNPGVSEPGALLSLPATDLSPAQLLIGGGQAPFEGTLWQWVAPAIPCN